MTERNSFQDTIKAYLDQRAQTDELFAVSYAKENKNIKDCCNYITSRAKEEASQGCAVIADNVVFGWAVHYYDEDDIKVEKTSNTRSEVKTSEAKTEIKKEVLKSKTKKNEDINQLSFF